MALGQLILDTWASLNHKALMGETTGSDINAVTAPTWVPKDERRRINAYMILQAYLSNSSRWYVVASADDRERRREYGDPSLVVGQVASAMIGRGARVSVDGADQPPAEAKDGDAPPVDSEGEPITMEEFNFAVARQREIDAWTKDEAWPLRMLSAEQECAGLGDTVLWLTWSERKQRVRVRRLDPGFYFPVYTPGEGVEDYPEKIHLAWEFEAPDQLGKTRRYVRRITYELVDVDPRTVAYQDEPVTQTCLMTDATWDLNDARGNSADWNMGVATIAQNDAGQAIDQLDLGLDFIPVVHIPNTDGEPWGRSVLLNIAQILDDLQVADTDAFNAADVAGAPPIAIAGSEKHESLDRYGPGTVWYVPVGGMAEVLDTSKGLESLIDHRKDLFTRMSTNSRVPEEILGRVSANDVPSGSALALSFAPFEVLIDQGRQIRGPKYELLFKMVQRLHIHHGKWQPPVRRAAVAFGAALPSDLSSLAELISKMLGSRAVISRATAVRAVANAGFDIDDVAQELQRIEAEDYEGGNLLYRATRSPVLAAEYLGLTPPEDVLLDQLKKHIATQKGLNDVRAILEAAGIGMDSTQVGPASDTLNDNGMPRNASTGAQKTPAGAPGQPANPTRRQPGQDSAS